MTKVNLLDYCGGKSSFGFNMLMKRIKAGEKIEIEIPCSEVNTTRIEERIKEIYEGKKNEKN